MGTVATVHVPAGNVPPMCRVRAIFYDSNESNVKTYFFEWGDQPPACVDGAYLEGAMCACSNGYILLPFVWTEANPMPANSPPTFYCQEPTCEEDGTTDKIWNTYTKMCVCKDGKRLDHSSYTCIYECMGGES